MSKMLSVKRWSPASYMVEDDNPEAGVITMELKRLRYDEANRLLVANMQAFGALTSAVVSRESSQEAETMAEKMAIISSQADAAKRFYEALPPELMEWIFNDCIRKVGGLEDEDGPVTTGPALRDFADQKMVLWIMTSLQANASLSSKEGKAFSSPSTSGLEGQTSQGESGPYPALTTGPGDGETSTAPPTPN